MRQFDGVTAFLNGVVDDEISMVAPDHTRVLNLIVGMEFGTPNVVNQATRRLSDLVGNNVSKMQKTLKGLKQAGRRELLKIGAIPTKGDASIYVKGKGDDPVITVVYEEDIVVCSLVIQRRLTKATSFSSF